MGSSADENRKHAWDAVIRELVAKGEVSEDVLCDSDAIIRWWRSLDPTKQEEIKSRVKELTQSTPTEVPEAKTRNELEALAKEWIKLRDKFGLGDEHALIRIVEIEKELKDQYNIAKPIEWLLAFAGPSEAKKEQVPKKRKRGCSGCLGFIVALAIILVVFNLFSSNENPRYVYEDGGIHVGADGNPIELINNPNATNPTYAELIAFITEDATDGGLYWRGGNVCSDFAEEVHNNAETKGIRAAWVSINLMGEEIGHALNAFETTDRGLVYVDCTGASFGERLRPLGASSSYTPTPKPTSRDSVAYVEIGKEYGRLDIAKAKSPLYSFYDEYKLKEHACDRLISEYNEEVMRNNQRIEAWGARLEEKKQMIDRAYIENAHQEYNMLIDDYNNEVVKYNQEIEAIEVKLEEKKQVIVKLAEELGDYCYETLGIVEDIHIHWGS